VAGEIGTEYAEVTFSNNFAGPCNRAVLGEGFDRLGAETVGSNATKGMDDCNCLFIIIISIIHLTPCHWRYTAQFRGFQNAETAPLGGAVGPLGGASFLYEGYNYVERTMGTRYKTYFGRNFVWLRYFTYHLVPVLAPNYKQHTFSPAKVRKVCYSLAEIYVRSVYLNLFRWTEVNFMKHLRGAQAISVWELLVQLLRKRRKINYQKK
jgi:hypothetical protein